MRFDYLDWLLDKEREDLHTQIHKNNIQKSATALIKAGVLDLLQKPKKIFSENA